MTKRINAKTMLLTEFLVAASAAFGESGHVQITNDLNSQADVLHSYHGVLSDITYRTANNVDLKLDLYQPGGPKIARPTLIFVDGGGRTGGFTKETFQLMLLPFLRLHWVEVNVDYRPSSVSLAPAAVEDCLCAMRWVIRNPKKYDIDTNQLVIMGNSAGGHLALTTGLIPLSNSGFGGPLYA